MRLKYKFVVRKVMDEFMAVPVGKEAYKFHGMLQFDDVGELIFRQLETDCTLEDIVKAVQEEYDGDEAVIREDVQNFVNRLKEAKLLTDN